MNKFINMGIIVVLTFLISCSEPENESDPQFLLKTSFVTVSRMDFTEELELKIAAYPYNIRENPAEYNEMVIFLVSSLSEESMILSAAMDKKITISEEEFLKAEKELKKDYPDDSFNQMLLKNAISHSFWKKRFLKTLIMDKIINLELKQKIVISPNDIVEFYKKNTLEGSQATDNQATVLNKIDNEKELVSRLRMQKTQDSYGKWIQEIEQAYPVEINKEILKTFLIDTKNMK